MHPSPVLTSRSKPYCLMLSVAGVWFHFASAAVDPRWRSFPGARVLRLPALPCGPWAPPPLCRRGLVL